MIGRLEGPAAAEHVGHLPGQQSELRPVHDQVVEIDEPLTRRELPRDRGTVALEHRRPEPGLHSPVQLDQLDLHVDGAREFGMRRLDAPQFENLPGLHPAGAGTLLVHGRFWPEGARGGKRRPVSRAAARAHLTRVGAGDRAAI